MAVPSTAITRFDLSISYAEFSLLANQRKFIGLRVLPALMVAQQASDFMKVTVESFLGKVKSTKRAEKGSYQRDDYEWTTDNYATEDHGKEEVLDDRSIKRYGNEIRAEAVHRTRAINAVLQAFEQDVADAVFNTTTWTGATLTTAISTPWTTKATADPVADVDAAVDKVETSSGMEPNSIILTKKAFRAALRTDRLEDLLKYDSTEVLMALQSGQNSKLVTKVMGGLHDLWQLENIIVGRGFKNTADEGQTAAFGRFWDDTKAMVCHINDDGMMGDIEQAQPNIGRTFMWADENVAIPGDETDTPGVIIEEYREENKRGGIIRARNDRGIKIIHPEAGHLLTAASRKPEPALMTVSIEDTSYAKPWDNLKNTLAASARFQTLADVATAEDAKDKIKFFWWSSALSASDNIRCTLRGLDDDLSDQFALGAYERTGPIVMFFQFVTPLALRDNHEDAGLTFLNHLGKIAREMESLADGDPSAYLRPTTIGLGVHGEGDPKDNNNVPHWGGELIYSWIGQ
eukprot:g26685.t1